VELKIELFFPEKNSFKQYCTESSEFKNELLIGIEEYARYSFAVVIYTCFEIFGSGEIRKKSSFFQKPGSPFPDVMLTPPHVCHMLTLKGNDY
jgi:hypothetical protein